MAAITQTGLFGLIIILALLDWLAVFKGWRSLEFIAKPAVMAALIAWLGVTAGFSGPLAFFGLGLLFSLAGDVFLLLPPSYFLPGLVSFLIAHLMYITGLNSQGPLVGVPALAFAVVLLVIGGFYYKQLSKSLAARGLQSMRIPILVYIFVIGLMLLSAWLTLFHPEWALLPALLAASGALFFFASDGILAWDRFIKPLPAGPLLIMAAYHTGQILLTVGAAIQFGGSHSIAL
jgi:uncharacterized membrane protein YhhN